MTAPAASTPPPQPAAQQTPTNAAVPAAALAALLAALASGATARIVGALVRAGVPRDVAAAVITAEGATATRIGGVRARTGAGWAARTNLARRARFVLAASRRVAAAVRAGTPLADAAATERRYFRQHRRASDNRTAAGQAVDAVAQQTGSPVLRWKTRIDPRTTPDCRAMDGRLFDIRKPPKIGLPGAVHPNCRCTATPANPRIHNLAKDEPEMNAHALDPATGRIIDLATGRYVEPAESAPRSVGLAYEQGGYGPLSDPSTADGWGSVLRDDQQTPDPRGPLAPAPDDDTIALVNQQRRNNPALYPSLAGLTDHEVAVRMTRAPVRMPDGFHPDGTRQPHGQQPAGQYVTADNLFRRPGETEIDRLNRVDAAELPARRAAQADAADYVRRMGLTWD